MVKIGRNAPCPCGSGKKYKKCCLLPKAGKEQEYASSTKFIPVYTQLDQLSNSVVDLIRQNRLDEAESPAVSHSLITIYSPGSVKLEKVPLELGFRSLKKCIFIFSSYSLNWSAL